MAPPALKEQAMAKISFNAMEFLSLENEEFCQFLILKCFFTI